MSTDIKTDRPPPAVSHLYPDYGIDAPGLVRTFFAISAAFFLLGALLSVLTSPDRRWLAWAAGVALIPSIYALFMGCFMVWFSRVAKVRGREFTLDQVDWRGDENVLDVGCGRGLMAVGAARRLKSGYAVGVDIWLTRDQSANSSSAIGENAALEGVADRVRVQTADMRALPFTDATFDVVVSNWVVHNLERCDDRSKALAEMARVLKPAGTLLLSDIANRDEYVAVLQRHGFGHVRVALRSPLQDRFNGLISFGSFQPATIVARR